MTARQQIRIELGCGDLTRRRTWWMSPVFFLRRPRQAELIQLGQDAQEEKTIERQTEWWQSEMCFFCYSSISPHYLRIVCLYLYAALRYRLSSFSFLRQSHLIFSSPLFCTSDTVDCSCIIQEIIHKMQNPS